MTDAQNQFTVFDTAAGWCGIGWNGRGIVRFHLPEKTQAAAERAMQRKLGGAHSAEPTEAVTEAIAAARRYFAGEAVEFDRLTLDLDGQEPFFRQIYEALRRVGWGRTTTYGTLAKELGAGPEAARDVGQAMAKNPVPLIIPCHRVLAAGGRIGGFSAPGGAASKQRMLELEGAAPAGKPAPAQQTFGF
jgi:methylated-DNA-[protein]-cysteine S-methyltransferase